MIFFIYLVYQIITKVQIVRVSDRYCNLLLRLTEIFAGVTNIQPSPSLFLNPKVSTSDTKEAIALALEGENLEEFGLAQTPSVLASFELEPALHVKA